VYVFTLVFQVYKTTRISIIIIIVLIIIIIIIIFITIIIIILCSIVACGQVDYDVTMTWYYVIISVTSY